MSFSNVPISSAIHYPELELVSMNGFAWTNKQGIILESQQSQQAPVPTTNILSEG